MTLIFSQIVWMWPLSKQLIIQTPSFPSVMLTCLIILRMGVAVLVDYYSHGKIGKSKGVFI